MNCPACHADNADQSSTCSACGSSLHPKDTPSGSAPSGQVGRRSGSRRRPGADEPAAANDTDNPAAWRAYRVALWSLIPFVGLLLGPLAVVLGCRAVRTVGDDASARNRARASILFGSCVALTQWLGLALMVWGWRS
jgi:hypothetical protein